LLIIFERRQQPGIRVPEQASSLNVSQGIIRNDLNALEEEGLVQRVHGGAALNETGPSGSAPRSQRKTQ
jgi:DeoR family transcriptional regulator, lactose phosphotransferase system repressor